MPSGESEQTLISVSSSPSASETATSASEAAAGGSEKNQCTVAQKVKCVASKLVPKRLTPQGMPAALLSRPWLRKADLFSYKPIPQHYLEDFSSFRGLIATFLLVVGSLVYLGLTAQKFSEGTYLSLSQIQVAQSPDVNVPVPPQAILFRKRDYQGIPKESFYDPRYFKFFARQNVVYEQDRLPRNITEVEMVPCSTLPDDARPTNSWLAREPQAQCPSVPLIMRGRYEDKKMLYSEIHILACSNSTPYHYKNGTKVICAPEKEISQLIAFGRFQLITKYAKTDVKEEHEEITLLLLLYEKYFVDTMLYTRVSTTLTPNFVSHWIAEYFNSVVSTRDRIMYYISGVQGQSVGNYAIGRDGIRQNYSVGGRLIATVGSILDSFRTEEIKTRMTIFDFFALVSALATSLHMIMALYFTQYAEDKFHARRPAWTNFNDDFVSMNNNNNKSSNNNNSSAAATTPLTTSAASGKKQFGDEDDYSQDQELQDAVAAASLNLKKVD